MASDTKVPADSTNDPETGRAKPKRLYYLDWLRVILILGVFLFHAVHPFSAELDWHIGNAERSEVAMGFLLLINPWGLPLFFLVAGAGSMFSLRRRSNRQYVRERVNRLLIPFIVGSILLSPLQYYLEALHKGTYQGSFLKSIPEWLADSVSRNVVTPGIFGRWGFHLWFLAFLFLFSLLALPVFGWFKRDAGRSFIDWLGRLVEKRGATLLFVIPLGLLRIPFQTFSAPQAHGWLDFVYFFAFFLLGYIFFSDERFPRAVRRDTWLLFAASIVGLAAYFALTAVYGDIAFEWAQTFVVPWSIILIFSFTLTSWGWAVPVLSLAMARWNSSNRWLEYGNETIMPFYLLHQPVIIVISYFVVQWATGITVKFLVVTVSSFVITLGLVELLIRPFGPVRRIFGMKARGR
jgi:peptidoglycan/LPS O-acetylase OafA/YrhL